MLFFIFGLWGCTATCEDVCTKIHTCDNIDQGVTNSLDCTSSCRSQQEEADLDENTEAFDALKDCLSSKTCEEIEAGVCYEESLYSW